jgi:hypothetical protein
MKAVLIDTNILILVMFAAMNRDPAKDSRLSRYNSSDLRIITEYIVQYDVVFTNPNVLTEVSNLIKGYDEYCWLSQFVDQCQERYAESRSLVNESELFIFGLADLSLAAKEFSSCTVLTDDSKLALYLAASGKLVNYYQEIREHFFSQKFCNID